MSPGPPRSTSAGSSSLGEFPPSSPNSESSAIQDVIVKSIQAEIEKGTVVSTRFLNKDWLKNLKNNYHELVIDQCSRKVKDAVEGNSKFESLKETRDIRLAVIQATIDHIHSVFGGVGNPLLREMREIAAEMGVVYPAMFKDDIAGGGYGLGGTRGNAGLAGQMLDMLRGRAGSRKRKDDDNDEPEVNPVKKGKRKLRYGKPKCFIISAYYVCFLGVDNDKWYLSVDTAAATGKLSRVTEEMEFEEREKLYEECRKELMSQFRLLNFK